jgi:hypothetical protein
VAQCLLLPRLCCHAGFSLHHLLGPCGPLFAPLRPRRAGGALIVVPLNRPVKRIVLNFSAFFFFFFNSKDSLKTLITSTMEEDILGGILRGLYRDHSSRLQQRVPWLRLPLKSIFDTSRPPSQRLPKTKKISPQNQQPKLTKRLTKKEKKNLKPLIPEESWKEKKKPLKGVSLEFKKKLQFRADWTLFSHAFLVWGPHWASLQARSGLTLLSQTKFSINFFELTAPR